MNILDKIAEVKRAEVEAMKSIVPERSLKVEAFSVLRSVLSMSGALRRHTPGVIAEHKRRSPSKGEIAPMSDVAAVAASYALNGAAAMSVLTDTPYFGGSATDLALARRTVPTLPILRKEFIVDEYQIYESRIMGADAVLLIAAILDSAKLERFNYIAHSLGLETLIEVHTLEEISMVPEGADMVGINNRDLTSFSTDISNCTRLIEALPEGAVKVAESGIRNVEDVARLRDVGFDGFLIGEALMSKTDPGEALRAMTGI
ncbi:MAG: indole-3-glycerol phosphate synthase TrpC [Muribaculaceae bacterium]|nr:indole-3-glycerol phosphate synthase TrpC [Muribaculaceae bacterium]